ncbi:MAG: fasciclin domain-containing protein [Phycisphaerales bacterium]|nr:fasciclin domain-containing protein [Phycisphaerales bacterium]
MNTSFRVGAVALLMAVCGSASGQACSATGCSKMTEQDKVQEVAFAEKDIVDTAVSAGSFNTLAAALKAADLVSALKGAGPFTVFAPTDEAFAKLPAGTVETLLKPENKAKLQAILLHHVVSGEVRASRAVKLTGAMTLGGQRVEINAGNGRVTVDGANVVKADVLASNGVIHIIDRVILPADKNIVETAAAVGSFSTLLAAAKAAGLAELLGSAGPFTVLAPTDAAFEKLGKSTIADLLKVENKDKLATVLKYHVIPGRVDAGTAVSAGAATTAQGGEVVFGIRDGRLVVNGVEVIGTDVDASNGVIHVIDTVLLPE